MLGVLVLSAQALGADSFFTQRLDDPKAVTLSAEKFGAKGDGVADDTAALQAAINAVQESTRKGVVFIPEGRYRLTKLVYVWNGIRLVGVGAKRPVLVLADKTPGFQEGEGKFMLHFCHERPREGQAVRDGTPSTFYSAMSNVDMEIGQGNPAAVCVRFHTAQHCYLAHIDFHIGSGKAGIEGVGNEAEDLHFFGGDFGIITATTPPSWPFVLIDATFEGQRKAGIQTIQNGMTLVRAQFKNVPTAVAITEGRWESLWMKDCRMEDVSGPAIIVGEEGKPRTRINLENVVCSKVPTLVAFPSGTAAPGKQVISAAPIYEVKEFSYGLQFKDVSAKGEMAMTRDLAPLAALPAPVPSDLAPLPDRATWVNAVKLGAKGDGTTDDTAAIKKAIAENRTIFFPTGRYRVTDTLVLKPDTVLVGLHPMTTQIVLADKMPAYAGDGEPRAVIEAPKGGTCIMMGIGIDTGVNPRACGAKWMAGKDSVMDDVRFVGGHGVFLPDGTGVRPYNADRTGDGDPEKKWDSQPYSLWITNGGGGTFANIWSPNPVAHAGVGITDTQTEGRLYAVSVEHHVKTEVVLKNASNWRIYGLQTEEERAEGFAAISTDIENCSHITFANLWLFRVTIPTAAPYGVRVKGSSDLNFRGIRMYSPSGLTNAFENSVFDVTRDVKVAAPEIGWLRVVGESR
jgi:hypothetical protein